MENFIFCAVTILDVWQSYEYASEIDNKIFQ